MFIEECTWDPHLQKRCGGSRVRQREKLNCNANPKNRWKDLSELSYIWPKLSTLHALPSSVNHWIFVLGTVWTIHESPLCSWGHNRLRWKQSLSVLPAVMVASPFLWRDPESTSPCPPHWQIQKCKGWAEKEKPKVSEVQMWINSLWGVGSAGRQRKKEGVGNSVRGYF